MFARMSDPFSGYGRRAYFDPYGYDEYQYIQQQQELARQAELEAAYRREMAARAYRHKLEQEEQRRAYQQQQHLLQEQERRRVLAQQLREQQQCHPRGFFFGQPSQCHPHQRQQTSPRPVFVPVRRRSPSPSPEQQEHAARVLQKQWRRHQLERKATSDLKKVLQELASLKGNVAFPAQPVFDTEGRLLYNSANAPVHGYVDALEKLLLKLDAIESHGLDSIKSNRRQVVHAIEQELARVEAWKRDSFKPQSQPLALPAQPIVYPGGLNVTISDNASASASQLVDQARESTPQPKQLSAEEPQSIAVDEPESSHAIAVVEPEEEPAQANAIDETEEPTPSEPEAAQEPVFYPGGFDVFISDGTDSQQHAADAPLPPVAAESSSTASPSQVDSHSMAVDQAPLEQLEQSSSSQDGVADVPLPQDLAVLSIDQDESANSSASVPIHFESSASHTEQAAAVHSHSAESDAEESDADLVSLESDEAEEAEPYVVV